MKTSATNRKIRVLLTAIRNGTLLPRPEFQRRLVWSNKHKISFLETVLLGYPFPEIYIAAGDVDPDTGEGTELLVDGQQRVTTLHQYFTGSPDLRLGSTTRPYAALLQQEKLDFLEYEVVVRDLGKKSIEEIKEIFRRINSTKYSLNAMEIHNARFDGAFKRFGEELAQHDFFERNRVFKTNEIRRMGDIAFTLTFLVTAMSTYFNRDTELEPYLEKYNDEFDEGIELRGEVERVFRFVDLLNFPQNCRAWKKADLLTLLVEVHRLLEKDKVTLNVDEVSARIHEFYNRVDSVGAGENEAKEIQRYYKSALQATNDRSSRISRGEVLRQILSVGLPEKPES